MKLWKFAHNHFHSRGTPLQVFRSLSSIRLIFWFQIRTKVASKTHFEDQFDKYRALKFQFEIITKMRNGPCKRYWKILFFFATFQIYLKVCIVLSFCFFLNYYFRIHSYGDERWTQNEYFHLKCSDISMIKISWPHQYEMIQVVSIINLDFKSSNSTLYT